MGRDPERASRDAFTIGGPLGGRWWLEMDLDRAFERSALEAALEWELRDAGPCGGYLRIGGWTEESRSFWITCAPPLVDLPDPPELGRVDVQLLIDGEWTAVANVVRSCCEACPFTRRYCRNCCAIV